MRIKNFILIILFFLSIPLFADEKVRVAKKEANFFSQFNFKYLNPFVREKRHKKKKKIKKKSIKKSAKKKPLFPDLKLISLSSKAAILQYNGKILILKKGELFLERYVLFKLSENSVLIMDKKTGKTKRIYLASEE